MPGTTYPKIKVQGSRPSTTFQIVGRLVTDRDIDFIRSKHPNQFTEK